MKSKLIIFTLSSTLFISSLSCNSEKKNKQNSINLTEKQLGLKDVSSFPIGNAVSITNLLKDKELQEINLREFNSLTSGNDMKMYRFAPEEGKYDWTKADKLAEFCKVNNFRFFGHTLVWHFALPKWIEKNAREQGYEWLDAFLKDYITTVVTRYKGKVAAWDVVNEGFATKGGEYRNSVFYEIMGSDYIEKAFIYAHAADSNADLFYNDFNIERDTAKLHGVLKMIEKHSHFRTRFSNAYTFGYT
jgi:endo-1,4-beta-xylanase